MISALFVFDILIASTIGYVLLKLFTEFKPEIL